MSGAERQTSFTITCRFHGDLALFLRKGERGHPIRRILREKTSVKDALEACGVPHTETDLIICNGVAVRFTHQLADESDVEVHGVGHSLELFPNERLQTIKASRFVADGHLGRLVRDLRLLGIDVSYRSTIADAELVAIAVEENRAVLTRDRRLLMHRALNVGYWLRSQSPEVQTVEVLRRFQLEHALRPFSRCVRCNAELAAASKGEVFEQLEPLTKIYYEDFRRCTRCGAVYWPGSHFPKLQARIEGVLSAVRRKGAEQ